MGPATHIGKRGHSPDRKLRLVAGATLLAVFAVAAALVARSGAGHTASRAGSHASRAPAATPSRIQSSAGATSALGRLSIDQLAGQRIIYAYSGLEPPSSLLSAIRAGEAAGVIFFGPNVSSPAQLGRVIKELQQADARSPVHAPLLMLTDQEGGEVRRLAGPPTLSEKLIGESNDAPELARNAGGGAGRLLARVGINVNLAPVVDVYRQSGNFIDEFQRSYSSDPSTVGRLAGLFISAQQRRGVAATAKHFPGLGAASRSQNTDLNPASLRLSLEHIRTVDEAPYRSAIANGVKLVMTSWAIYPTLDPRLPAGLSPRIIQGELRRRLGFRGVTITDGIEAGALRRYGPLGQRGVLAAGAGADLILCVATNPNANTPGAGTAVLNGIARAIRDGRLGRRAAESAATRILALRSGRTGS